MRGDNPCQQNHVKLSAHWLWVRASGAKGKRVVLFDYDPSRGKAAPLRLLAGFKGIIMTDGYQVYDELAATNGLTHAECMAHLRHYFYDAKKIAKLASRMPIRRSPTLANSTRSNAG